MCTATWFHEENGYHLLFNRDEQRTRKPALPPRLSIRDGVRFLAPVDGDFGGTWIAINELGLSVCLLNGANLASSGTDGTTPHGSRSRGLLVLELISAPSVAFACDRLLQMNLSEFAPFTVAAIEPGGVVNLAEWNGAETTVVRSGDSRLPLASSSYDAEGARAQRREEFLRGVPLDGPQSVSQLFEFHRSHGHAPSAYSTCMHRGDAKTVSFSWIQVTRSQVKFVYTPGSPCESVPAEGENLPRLAL